MTEIKDTATDKMDGSVKEKLFMDLAEKQGVLQKFNDFNKACEISSKLHKFCGDTGLQLVCLIEGAEVETSDQTGQATGRHMQRHCGTMVDGKVATDRLYESLLTWKHGGLIEALMDRASVIKAKTGGDPLSELLPLLALSSVLNKKTDSATPKTPENKEASMDK